MEQNMTRKKQKFSVKRTKYDYKTKKQKISVYVMTTEGTKGYENMNLNRNFSGREQITTHEIEHGYKRITL
jgi:hypothetical protein